MNEKLAQRYIINNENVLKNNNLFTISRQSQISKVISQCRDYTSKFPQEWHKFLRNQKLGVKSSEKLAVTPRSLVGGDSAWPDKTDKANLETSFASSPTLDEADNSEPISTFISSPPPQNTIDDFLSEWTAFQQDTTQSTNNNGNKDNMKITPRSFSVTTNMEDGLTRSDSRKPKKVTTVEPVIDNSKRDPFIDLVCVCFALVEVFGMKNYKKPIKN